MCTQTPFIFRKVSKIAVILAEYCGNIPDAYMNGYQQYCRYFNSIHATIYVTHWKGRIYTLNTQ